MTTLSFQDYLEEVQFLEELPYLMVDPHKPRTIDLEVEMHNHPDHFVKHIQNWVSGKPITLKSGATTSLPSHLKKEFTDKLASNQLFQGMVRKKFGDDAWNRVHSVLRNS